MELDELKKGAEKFGSPTYFFDIDRLREKIGLIKKIIDGRAGLCYAIKANPFLVREMAPYVDRFEACSPGEYEICRRAGIAPDRIIVSGVNKTHEAMERVMELGGGRGIFTVESPGHYRILSKLAKQRRVRIKVLIRLSSGNQFGVDRASLEDILAEIKKDDFTEFCGIHYYSGTQKRPQRAEKELERLGEYMGYLTATYGVEIKELEYGPGLPAAYFEGDTVLAPAEALERLRGMLEGVSGCGCVTVEIGRFIAAECGYYITSVMDVKNTDGNDYCIVDGGIHQLSYYGQMMGMKKPFMRLMRRETAGSTGTPETAETAGSTGAPEAAGTAGGTEAAGGAEAAKERSWCVFGSLCTVNDVIVKDVRLPELREGDYFVFENCGAYSVTEGMSLFLSRELPQIVFYSKEKGFRLVRGLTPTWGINSYEED